MPGQFAGQIEDWVLELRGGLEAVIKESVQEVVRLVKVPVAAGGNMPIDTSFLQNSLQASKSSMPQMRPDHTPEHSPPHVGNAAVIEEAISSFKLGDTLHFGFTAAYAARQNYGFVGTDSLGRNYNQSGRYFVETAVQEWPRIVEKYQRQLAARLAFGGD